MYYRSRGIILKSMDLREADQLLTIFSEKAGKIKAVAKGSKKTRSSLRGCIQPFCHSQLFFSAGKDMDLITQGKIIDFYGNTREDFDRTLYALYILELLDKSLMDRAALPVLYLRTIAVLDFLNQRGYNPLTFRYFEMSLLSALGYTPILDHCVNCASKEILVAVDMAEGGMLCSACTYQGEHTLALKPETLALAKLLLNANVKMLDRVRASEPALKQLEIFLEKYLEYHLERRFNMKNIMRTLKRLIPS
ncbi:MAG: DNA repair protein RecO [Syntrophomonadaceae bacterium]|nr:DNA repair protein RecO [Syntrophomonadaceae bacterium]MDD3023650.1 DNA repair protein RecO [Syntrophomonadaceae bacterium]